MFTSNNTSQLYLNKYLKYKQKYLNLKTSLIGGKLKLRTALLDDDVIKSDISYANEVSDYAGTEYEEIIKHGLFNVQTYYTDAGQKRSPLIFWVLNHNKIYDVDSSNRYYPNRFQVIYYYLLSPTVNSELFNRNFLINLKINKKI